MLARVRPGGEFELLTSAAWVAALGYTPEELTGKPLRDLMQLASPVAGEVLSLLVDQAAPQPLEVKLLCKDKRLRSFRLHRQFDAYDEALFMVVEELAQETAEPRRASASPVLASV